MARSMLGRLMPGTATRWSVTIALLTSAFVTLGAGLAAVAIRSQIRDLRLIREGASRPYLVLHSAQAIRSHDWLAVNLENIGSGPALHIRVEGRLIEEPPGWPETAEWYTRQMVRAAFSNEEERRHPLGELHAIGAGQIGTVWFTGTWPVIDERDESPCFIGIHVTYRDLFEEEFRGGLDGELWSTVASED